MSGGSTVTITMTDRIAQTIYAMAEAPLIDGLPVSWENLPAESKSPFWRAARNILAIMRFPTAQMISEGDRRDLPHDATNVWERMLFAAMSEDHL